MIRIVRRCIPPVLIAVLAFATALPSADAGTPSPAEPIAGPGGSLRGVVRGRGIASEAAQAAPISALPAGLALGARPQESTAAYIQAKSRERTDARANPAAMQSQNGPRPLIGSVGAGFDGASELIALSPSDSTGALGSTHYVGAVNVNVEVFDAAGTTVGGPQRLRTLGPVLPTGAFDFDPKVVYDQYDGQFVLVFLAVDKIRRPQHSWIVIGTSPDSTASDLSSWCFTRISGDQTSRDGQQFADYPAVGYTGDRVTISTNQFSGFGTNDRFVWAQVISIPKSALYDPGCSGPLPGKVFADRATRDPDGTKAFSIQPAQTYGGVVPPQYMLSFEFKFPSGGRKLIVWRIRHTTGGFFLSKVQRKVGTAFFPPYGTQKGGSVSNPNTYWDTGDLRLINASYDVDRNRLYGAHAVQHNTGTSGYVEAAARIYVVAPNSDLQSTTVPRKLVVGHAGLDIGWPAVTSDPAGNVFVTYSQAGVPGDQFLSALATEITLPGVQSDLVLKAGQARYEANSTYPYGIERWGDYNAVNRDPDVPADIAVFNQYALSDGSPPTSTWQQWVAQVSD